MTLLALCGTRADKIGAETAPKHAPWLYVNIGVSVSDMVWVLRFGKMFMDVAGVRAIVVVDPIVIRP